MVVEINIKNIQKPVKEVKPNKPVKEVKPNKPVKEVKPNKHDVIKSTRKRGKFYTKKYGKHKIRDWKNKSEAEADAKHMRRQGYKVRLTPDKKSVIVLGKTTRGYARTIMGQRADKTSSQRKLTVSKRGPRKKPYTPLGYQTFRQPSFRLRKLLGWEI